MNIAVMKEMTDFLERKEVTTKTAYRFPSAGLLKDHGIGSSECKLGQRILERKLEEFGIAGKVKNVAVGPMISRYEIKLGAGVKLSTVRSVSEDLAVALMAERVRILAPIPGTSLVGVEVRNEKQDIIGFKAVLPALLASKEAGAALPFSIAVDTMGKPSVLDLAKMPHLLIAGQTGSGKSVALNSLILSLLYTQTPEDLWLILIDPKRVEFSGYAGIPHVGRMKPIVEAEEATEVFNELVREMGTRYEELQKAGVRNIEGYRAAGNHMSYIVVVVDEMADLMMTSGKTLERDIVRLAQLARAVGIHLVLATQKPITKVVTGLIKGNMPSRIAFQVASGNDSRVILDCNGAESLFGRGDMLAILPGQPEPERFHGVWVSDDEIRAITKDISK